METIHRSSTIFNQTAKVTTNASGYRIIPYYIDHVGKGNHKLIVNIEVMQPTKESGHDIKFFIVNDNQFVNWLSLIWRTDNRFKFIRDHIYGTKQIKSTSFSVDINEGGIHYFILDNRYSSFTSKQVSLRIDEYWDEFATLLDFVATIPPHDRTLYEEVKKMISNSKNSLKIITPYIDMLVMAELLTKKEQNVDVKIITRDDKDLNGKEKRTTYRYLKENFSKSHKTDELIHSRIIIRDNEEVLVSSADLTQDSLLSQYNAGIKVADNKIVKGLLEYFEKIWNK